MPAPHPNPKGGSMSINSIIGAVVAVIIAIVLLRLLGVI
jgi:hypothetical protein